LPERERGALLLGNSFLKISKMRHNKIRKIIMGLLGVMFFTAGYSDAQKVIRITDYDVRPGTRKNASVAIKKAVFSVSCRTLPIS
jgi:hypothetical protein